ncbi:MAG TPA: DUF502 domain-containing protein [Tepidisphaeraceae bacterium]|jgi:uncharacterized membrane protein|nr:DUF502 domain-containing protein [Tepidisphaeraceae bacterium]
MLHFQKHLRNTFLAGIFAAIPVALTVFIVWWVESKTRPAAHFLELHLFHRDQDIPFLGVVLALLTIYVAGLVTTSLLGKLVLGLIDRTLLSLPVVRQLYQGWKHVALTPGGTEGIFSKVALIPDETGHTLLLGFTSGKGLEGQPNVICVFVPAAPNPINGRLYFVRKDTCHFVDISTEEAFKIILSTGNYVPPEVGAAAAAHFETTAMEPRETSAS